VDCSIGVLLSKYVSDPEDDAKRALLESLLVQRGFSKLGDFRVLDVESKWEDLWNEIGTSSTHTTTIRRHTIFGLDSCSSRKIVGHSGFVVAVVVG